jgi:hypothetical protein
LKQSIQAKQASKEIIKAIMDKANVKVAPVYQMIEEAKRNNAVGVRIIWCGAIVSAGNWR